jgi:hypothetical protein
MNPDLIEYKAEELITNDRAEDYGEAKHQFEMVAKVWSGITGQQIEAKHIAGEKNSLADALSRPDLRHKAWIIQPTLHQNRAPDHRTPPPQRPGTVY